VFDAVDAGWPMVDEPKLTVSDDGELHMLFSRYNAANRSAGIYYSHSINGGDAWLEVDTVSEVSISFRDILVARNGIVHVLWQESGNSHSIWHAYFDDPQVRWENRRSVQTSVIEPELSTLLEDANGDIHLLQIAKENRTGMTLKHWVWNDPQWNVVDFYQIQSISESNANSLLGAINSRGQMTAVYALPALDERINSEITTIFSISRALDIDSSVVAIEPTEEEPEDNLIPSIELATPVIAPIEANVETAMVAEENQPQIDMSPVDRPNQWSGLAIGVILGGVLTILILFAAVRSVRRRGLK
jgi:hypothetical protein